MKRYQQVCPIARSLDVVGDRWGILIVRELMIGPRRYSDLQDGLPGVGTNVLATRLRELTEAGVVSKRVLSPPAPAVVYELTDAGRALQPVLQALRQWGREHAPPPRRGDAARPAWVLMSAARAPAAPIRAGAVCELTVGAQVFELVADDEGFAVQGGESLHADVRVTIDERAFFALVSGDRARARKGWHVTEGDTATAAMFFKALTGTATAAVSAPR